MRGHPTEERPARAAAVRVQRVGGGAGGWELGVDNAAVRSPAVDALEGASGLERVARGTVPPHPARRAPARGASGPGAGAGREGPLLLPPPPTAFL